MAAHYTIGISFSALLMLIVGATWFNNPSLIPALLLCIGTVVAPFFIMQPCMGAGFAASNTPSPSKARIQSIINHTVFGFGLYVAAVALKGMQSSSIYF